MANYRTEGGGLGFFGWVVVLCIAAFIIFWGIAALGWVSSFKGVDSGQVCVVREGGPFDGRAIKEVRQPGEGPKPIGAWNHQDCFPTTERDSNEILPENQTFPTKDSVQVIADGQALFSFTTNEAKVKAFFIKYGRRDWHGHSITSDTGRLDFFRERVAPVMLDAYREVLGTYQCVQLNNLCQYVQNPEKVKAGKVKAVDNTQNLAAAQSTLVTKIKEKLLAAFGDNYFENVRYQNLRIRFEPEVRHRITDAQSLRTQAANAKLEADRRVAEARGNARTAIAKAEGARLAAKAQARAYAANPTQAQIDRIEAFCGGSGCDPQYIGGSVASVIGRLGR